jgi:hypothetical protein
VTQNLVGEGVLVKPMPGKKAPEHRSGLRPSQKELLEWCSGAFHYKNTPDFIKPEGALPWLQEPTTGYHSDHMSPVHTSSRFIFLRSHFHIILLSVPRSPDSLFHRESAH